MLLGFFFL